MALSTARGSGGGGLAAWTAGAAAAALLLVVVLAAVVRSPPSLPWSSSSPPNADADADFADGDDPAHVKGHWALLAAGSSGYGNYRHQSDVFHAYRVLLGGGFDAARVVVMAADDVAHSPSNPSPCRMFNHPRGADNYRGGGFVDYSGDAVTADTFLSVLVGDADAVQGLGTGRVVASGPSDRVFVFYSDHGSVGVLGMPSGDFLYADKLHAALRQKADAGGFLEMVLYVEACEAGSMFQGLMRDYDGECGREDGEGGQVRCEGGGEGDADGSGASTSSSHGGRRRLSLAPTASAFFAEAAESAPGQEADADDAAPSPPGGKHHRHGKKKKKGKRLGPPIFATTAANADESSWATYCPSFGGGGGGGDDDDDDGRAAGVPDDTCLGDLSSVAWMEDSDGTGSGGDGGEAGGKRGGGGAQTGRRSDLTRETLAAQFALVRARTSDGGTYAQGSHAMEYGAVRRLGWEVVGDYLGTAARSSGGGGGPSPSPSPAPSFAASAGGSRALLRAADDDRPRIHPHRLRQHEAYAAPLVIAALRARRGADEARREAAALAARAREAATAAAAGAAALGSDAEAASSSSPSDASRRRLRALLQQSSAQADEAALSTARVAETAEAAADAADAAMRADQAARRSIDLAARRAARVLLREGRVRLPATEGADKLRAFEQLLAASALPRDRHGGFQNTQWETMATPAERALLRAEGPFSRAGEPHRLAVDDWECLRAMVGAWDAARAALGCAPVGGGGGGAALGQYAMQHTRLLAALCNAGVEPGDFAAAVAGVPCAIDGAAEQEAAALAAAVVGF